jgi:hypothetical protein
MSRAAELFAVGAILLSAAALISRLAATPNQFHVSISARQTAYVFSIEQMCLVMASLFAIFAAIYSIWFLPLNHAAVLWHFWLTAGGTVLFWIGFVAFSRAVTSSRSVPTSALAYLGGLVLLLGAQGVFVANLVVGLITGRRV